MLQSSDTGYTTRIIWRVGPSAGDAHDDAAADAWCVNHTWNERNNANQPIAIASSPEPQLTHSFVVVVNGSRADLWANRSPIYKSISNKCRLIRHEDVVILATREESASAVSQLYKPPASSGDRIKPRPITYELNIFAFNLFIAGTHGS